MAENEICGTKDPTFHRLLLDTRFELPLGQALRHAVLIPPGALCIISGTFQMQRMCANTM